MKRIACIIFLILFTHLSFSQNIYWGFGGGINSYYGIAGVGINAGVSKNFFLRGAAGIGSWGSKLSAGLMFRNSVRVGPAKRSQISPDPATFVMPQLALAMRLVSHRGALSVK